MTGCPATIGPQHNRCEYTMSPCTASTLSEVHSDSFNNTCEKIGDETWMQYCIDNDPQYGDYFTRREFENSNCLSPNSSSFRMYKNGDCEKHSGTPGYFGIHFDKSYYKKCKDEPPGKDSQMMVVAWILIGVIALVIIGGVFYKRTNVGTYETPSYTYARGGGEYNHKIS